MYDWWLDRVCGEKRWSVVMEEQKGQAVAVLPLYFPLKDVVVMPPFTQTLGPWIAPFSADTKYTSRLGKTQAILSALIRRLPPIHFLSLNLHEQQTDWLPFYWAGFRQTTRYTYILPSSWSVAEAYERMSPNIRRNISKARDRFALQVSTSLSVEEFTRLQEKTLNRRGSQLSLYQRRVLPQLIKECQERRQGNLWCCRDGNGELLSAAFVAWSAERAYYIAGGQTAQAKETGAQSFLLWTLIQEALQVHRMFDFEGSMLYGVERFFREFGAIQTPYFQITKGRLDFPHRVWMKLRRDYFND